MTGDALLLVAGIASAALGGELFVRGAVGLAVWARIPSGIVGATVAATATSSPEIAVAVSAAIDGESALAVGDALGSNATNIGLVLALALLLARLPVERSQLRRDLAAALALPLATAALVLDGRIARGESVVLLGLFLAWLALSVLEARRARRTYAFGPSGFGARTLVAAALGVGLLVLAGQLIVAAATGIGETLGLDVFVVGATIVALATSTPELATALIARLRGHHELGLGTLLGSNVVNGSLIVGLATVIEPASIAWSEIAVGLGIGFLLVCLVIPSSRGVLGRGRGALLAAVYAVYVVALISVQPG